jgi:hypothetical protein
MNKTMVKEGGRPWLKTGGVGYFDNHLELTLDKQPGKMLPRVLREQREGHAEQCVHGGVITSVRSQLWSIFSCASVAVKERTAGSISLARS